MPNKLSQLWKEIKRRNVHRSLTVYAGTAFVILEASTIIFPRWGFPDWAVDAVLYLLIAGLFITFIVSWIYDVTPEGVQKTLTLEEGSKEDKPTASISWKIATYISLVVVFGLILFNVFQRNRITRDLLNMDKTIAVLPFENWSGDTAFSHLGDAIANEIITQLVKIKDFRVICFNSCSRFRGPDKPSMAQIGKELGASIIVDGIVERQDQDVSIQVRAIQVRSDDHLWANVYIDKWTNIFKIRTNIAISIAKELKTVLNPEELNQIQNIGTEDTDAYNLYLKGNYLFQQWNADACWRAIEVYKQAIALDSTYAHPFAGMAMAYFMLTSWDFGIADLRLIPVARKWALKALELDQSLGDPHYVLGGISYIHEWDWEAAEKAFLVGMELNPNHVWGRSQYSNLLYMMRRFDEAISISEYTMKLDPLDPTPYMELAGPYWCTGQKEKGIELNLKGLELFPGAWNFKRGLAYMYLEKGTNYQFILDWYEETLEEYSSDLQIGPAFALGDLGYIMAQMGYSEEAVRILNELTRRVDAGEDDITYMWMGLIYYVLGEVETAIDFLELSYEAREPFMFIINLVPEFNDEELRSNQRFKALIRKLGFET